MAHECAHDGLPSFGLSACYSHLKAQALNGRRDKLTDEELAFVGVGPSRRREVSDGWRSPIAILIDQLGAEVSAENVAVLERLAGMTQERLEFLG